MNKINKCQICDCKIHNNGEYAKPTIRGRSHASRHHYIAERFYGRTKNKQKYKARPIFKDEFTEYEKKYGLFCYECHEELLHNPIVLPESINKLKKLIRKMGYHESSKGASRKKIAQRIKLFQEIISLGIDELTTREG